MDEETVLKTAGCKSLGGSIPSSSALAVAQLVRAPDCGSGGRGFDSHRSPQMPQWWNGRHEGLKIPCQKMACRFESGLRYYGE
ncbi:hypothetical protein UFOVP1604_87 [uncultured Caudovirales phage]|uniref:Uncharacterized protein n=1 Tax=uncultured Caudovirales phage TaxID=2100421 RepID=A0A6J5SW52_9CAUD|nr:hypothetical protein UFOVP1604_87 [uncultured Caudovirales phage]